MDKFENIMADVVVEPDKETITFQKNPQVKEFLEQLLKDLQKEAE